MALSSLLILLTIKKGASWREQEEEKERRKREKS